MFRISLFLLLAFGYTSALSAQETPAPEATPVEESTPAVPDTETDPSSDPEAEADPGAEPTADPTPATETDEVFPVAEEAEGPAVGEQFVLQTHGDWELRCVKGEEEDTCRLYQLLQDGDGNGVAEINVVNLPSGGQATAGITLVTPLETLLTSQVAFRVDAGQAKRYPYSWCTQSGCYARFGMTSAEVNSLIKGNKAKVTIVAVLAPENPIDLELSLTGFTAAWKALGEL